MSFKTISIIGLGYVGLPLAVEFGKLFQEDESSEGIAAFLESRSPKF